MKTKPVLNILIASFFIGLLSPLNLHADWSIDTADYTLSLEPTLVEGDIFYQHWATDDSNPEAYLHAGTMIYNTTSWFGPEKTNMRSSQRYNGSHGFADYRLYNPYGNFFALNVTNWFSANQTDLQLDHYAAYRAEADPCYHDIYVDQNWSQGSPPGSGYGTGSYSKTGSTIIAQPHHTIRLQYGTRQTTGWSEWYGTRFRLWAASPQTQYHDNYTDDPFARVQGGPIIDAANTVWASGRLDNAAFGAQPMHATYIVAHQHPITTLDVRLTSNDLAPAAEAVYTASSASLNIALAPTLDGPWTTIWTGTGFYANAANPGTAYTLPTPTETIYLKIFSAANPTSHYARWGGFHLTLTSPPQPDTPATCADVHLQGLTLIGDINHDCSVDDIDTAALASDWLNENPFQGPTPPTASSTPTNTLRPFRQILGIGTHFGQGNLASNVDLLTDLHATWIRDGISWGAVEREQGAYRVPINHQYWVDAVNQAGINIILHLGYGNSIYENPYDPCAFADYAVFMAQKLQGKIQAAHCQNEPHNFGFLDYYGGSWNGADPSPWVAKYAETTRITANRVHDVMPDLPIMPDEDVIVNHYRFMDAGLGDHVSDVSWHPYNGGPPEKFGWDHPSSFATPYQVADEQGSYKSAIEMLKQKGLNTHGRPMEIYATELGWKITETLTQQQAANYLIRAYIASYAYNVKVLCWHTLQDTGDGEFGLVDNSLTPRLTYFAYQALAEILGDYNLVRQTQGQTHLIDGVHAYLFAQPRHPNILVFWSADDADYNVTITGLQPHNQLLDCFGNLIASDQSSPLSITATASPQYLIGTTLAPTITTE